MFFVGNTDYQLMYPFVIISIQENYKTTAFLTSFDKEYTRSAPESSILPLWMRNHTGKQPWIAMHL